jgi:hypothetical protein
MLHLAQAPSAQPSRIRALAREGFDRTVTEERLGAKFVERC